MAEESEELKEKLKGLKSDLKDMQSNFAQVNSAMSDMTANVNRLKNPLLSAVASIAKSNVMFQQRIQQQKKEIDITKTAIERQQKIAQEAQKRINQEFKNLQLLKKEEQEHLRRMNEATQNSILLGQRNKQIKSEIKLIDKNIAEQESAAREKLNAQKSELDRLKQAQSSPLTNKQRDLVFPELAGMTKAALNRKVELLEQEATQQQSVVDSLSEQARKLESLNAEAANNQSEIEKLSDVYREHRDLYRELGDKISDQQDTFEKVRDEEIETIKKSNSEQDRLAKKLARQEQELKLEPWKELASTIGHLADSLSSFIKTIRETQKRFGVGAGQAVGMQVGAAIESFQSMFSLDAMAGREEILGAQEAFRSQFGGVISSDAAKDLAIEAKNLGVTTEQMAAARRVFMTTTMGDVGEARAQQEQLIATFRQQGLTNTDAMEFISQNSELIARNGTRFAQSLTRAAADAKKIGVDLGKVDQIGDNIIGDFEGFLEKTAELGAMGFNLDSESLAQIAESGDTGALFNELRSQLSSTGKDITKLRRSEQLALSNAFGIPMAELQRMASGTTQGSGEEQDPVKESNGLLKLIVDSLEKLGSVFSVVAGVLSGAIAISTAITAAATTKMAAGGIGGLAGLKNLLGFGGSAAASGSAASGAAGAAGAVRTGASMAGRLGRFAKFGGRLLGKVALPLTAAMAAYDAYQGFAADPNASFGQRLGNAGSSMLSGMTFGLLGRDASEIQASATSPSAPRAVRPVSTAAQSQAQAAQNVNMAELSAKLDQVVRAIASMEVKLDGNKVGQIIVANEQRVSQLGTSRAQRT